MRTITIFLLLTVGLYANQQSTFSNKTAKFSFTIEYIHHEMVLTSHRGFTWKSLGYKTTEYVPVYVNRSGVAGGYNAADLKNSRILIKIEKTSNGWRMEGLKGTSWKKLEFSCKEENCRQKINQDGMVGEK